MSTARSGFIKTCKFCLIIKTSTQRNTIQVLNLAKRLLTSSDADCTDRSDKAKICSKHKHLCTREKYQKRMESKCPKTCCKITSTTSTTMPVYLKSTTVCVDAAPDKCAGLEVYCRKGKRFSMKRIFNLI